MMDRVLTDLYEALTELRYPEIAKIDLKDIATSILAGKNRITLLTWLLSRASPPLSSHLEKFEGKNLKDEVVKCYSQMGISNDENALLGNCSAKQQIPTLKALLLFVQSLDSTETKANDDSVVNEVLDKHINESINIIPPTCHVSMKMTNSEAKKYLQEVDTDMTDVICISESCKLPKIESSKIKNEVNLTHGIKVEDDRIMSLDDMAESFGKAFESTKCWGNPKSSDFTTSDAIDMDEIVQNLYENLSSVTQVFESKKAILATQAPKCLDKFETPLSLLIEDNVIFSEEIRNLYD